MRGIMIGIFGQWGLAQLLMSVVVWVGDFALPLLGPLGSVSAAVGVGGQFWCEAIESRWNC